MFQVVSKNETMPLNGVTFTIYGDAGLGKTTLANTASNPIVIDFDNGYHRSAFRQNFIPVKSWRDIAYHQDEFFAVMNQYDTIIIDTVGAMLDYVDFMLIENNPSLATKTMLKFGELKKAFSEFHRKLMMLGKDVIFIAHAKEKEENEQRILRMSITGSSYDLVVQKSDMVGYMSVINGKPTIDFDATEKKIGKNCAKIPQTIIPELHELDGFMAGLIQRTKNALQQHTAEQDASIQRINEFIAEGLKAVNIESLNAYIDVIGSAGLSKSEKLQVWNAVKKHGDSLGYVYNTKSKAFEVAS